MYPAESKRRILNVAITTTAAVTLTYIAFKNRKSIARKFRYLCDYKNPLRHKTVEVVENADDCQRVVNQLKRHCDEYKVLGFDCEWVTVGGSRRPTALLQLASHTGLCALIRLCSLKTIPKNLRELLEDDDVLKVGVAPHDDAIRICQDYGVGVASTFDLRFLAAQTNRKPEGLAKLAKSILNVELDKNWRVRCSDWEANCLTEVQIDYAAKDALVAIEIFKVLSQILKPRNFWEWRITWPEILSSCEPFIDARFKDGMFSTGNKMKGNIVNKKKEDRKSLIKPISRGISTRSKTLYDNCLLQAPDGELLCTCDRRKAQWYLNQNLAEIVSQDPFTVRLNFEPAGRAVGEVGKYYTIVKENQCVVCGQQEAYIRKNVVPREYRKHFPVVMKSHTSHDVLLLCPTCHQISNISDLKIRSKLAQMCEAPYMHEDGGAKSIEIPKLKQLRSAARALLRNPENIPVARRNVLKQIVLDHFSNFTEEIDGEMLQKAANIETMESVDNYVSHGEKVVQEFQTKFGGLCELEKVWRQHFLSSMHPKYLPKLWSVDHNASRLNIRASEGRIEDGDLVLAGLTTVQL